MKIADFQDYARLRLDMEDVASYHRVQEFMRQKGIDPNTFYQELEMSSRYVDTHRDVSWSNSHVSLHSHTFYELLYCRNSCGVEYLVGSERYRLQRGDIMLVPPGVSHRPLLPDPMTEPYKRYVVWISTEMVQLMTHAFPDTAQARPMVSYLIRTAGTRWEHIGEMFRNGVLEAENRQFGWETAVMGNTMLLLAQLRRMILDTQLKPLPMETPELLDQVMAYVEENLSRHITLADTAKHFFVSESTISQLFRKKMGVSFYRCVTQRRLIAAKSLIMEDMALEDVSRKVGFQDYSSFYRAFRQEYGISPRQFRQLHQEDSPE